MREEKQNPDQYPLGEPSVLDYVKSLLHLGSGERIRIPEEDLSPVIGEQLLEEKPVTMSPQVAAAALPVVEVEAIPAVEPELAVQESASTVPPAGPFPWRSLLALFLGLIGQRLFEPPPTTYPLGYAFYIGAFILLGWAIRRGEWSLHPLLPHSEGNDPQTYRLPFLIASLVLGVLGIRLAGK